MSRRDFLRFLEIGDRARDLQHTMIPPRRERQSFGGRLKESACRDVNRRVSVEPAPASVRIARNPFFFREALSLSRASALHSRAYSRRWISCAGAAKLPQRDRANYDVHVYAIRERAGDSRGVSIYIGRGAVA
jgi:hypothetical protein